MIMFFKQIHTNKKFIIMYVRKWYNILLEDLTLQFLLMDKLVVEKLTLCLEILMKKKRRELFLLL
jgi:hypothetical protein